MDGSNNSGLPDAVVCDPLFGKEMLTQVLAAENVVAGCYPATIVCVRAPMMYSCNCGFDSSSFLGAFSDKQTERAKESRVWSFSEAPRS